MLLVLRRTEIWSRRDNRAYTRIVIFLYDIFWQLNNTMVSDVQLRVSMARKQFHTSLETAPGAGSKTWNEIGL